MNITNELIVDKNSAGNVCREQLYKAFPEFVLVI